MKNQAVEINFTVMLYAGIMYTGLVISGWLLVRLTIACFKFPALLQNVERLKQNEDLRTEQQASVIAAGETVTIIVFAHTHTHVTV